MQQYNNTEFRKLLMTAIGSGTKQDFAERAGMTAPQLSRYLREDYRSRPSRTTLEKIATASGKEAILTDLLKACGYDVTEADNRTTRSIEERAELNAAELRSGLKELTSGVGIYSSLEEFFDAYRMLFSTETLTEIKISGRKEYNGSRYPKAELSAFARVKFETLLDECFTWVAVYFVETKGGSVVVLDTAIDPGSLCEAGALSEEDLSECSGKPFVYSIGQKPVVTGSMLRNIFGDREEILTTYIGFGFYLPVIPKHFKLFLLVHRDSFCTGPEEKMLFEKACMSDDIESVFRNYSYNGTGEGYESAVAKIMHEETGLPFTFYGAEKEVYEDNVPSVMLPDVIDQYGDWNQEYNLKELMDICKGYAGELGLSEYGEVHLVTTVPKTGNYTFSIDKE